MLGNKLYVSYFYHINRHKISKIAIKNIKIDDVFYNLFCLKPNRR